MHVEMYFDYASPYSYLADCRVDAMLPGVEVRRQPVYIRGLEQFKDGLPYTMHKLFYLAQDMMRTAALYGIDFNMPTNFPVNGLHLLRCSLALEGRPEWARFHKAAFRAVWVEDRDVGKPEVVQALCKELGVVPDVMQTVKDRLKADTARAESRRVFGVPTFFLDEEMYWGQDRLEQLQLAVKQRQT
jgi:2-hydroxychromene-2-carboxylate isomerase